MSDNSTKTCVVRPAQFQKGAILQGIDPENCNPRPKIWALLASCGRAWQIRFIRPDLARAGDAHCRRLRISAVL